MAHRAGQEAHRAKQRGTQGQKNAAHRAKHGGRCVCLLGQWRGAVLPWYDPEVVPHTIVYRCAAILIFQLWWRTGPLSVHVFSRAKKENDKQ